MTIKTLDPRSVIESTGVKYFKLHTRYWQIRHIYIKYVLQFTKAHQKTIIVMAFMVNIKMHYSIKNIALRIDCLLTAKEAVLPSSFS